jgi:ATP-binding cassette subfamily F protein 3
VEIFPGNYVDYLWRKQGGNAQILMVEEKVVAPTNGTKPQVADQNIEDEEPKQRRLNPIKLKQMKERCAEIEEEISRLEAGIADCESALTTFVSATETSAQTSQLKAHKENLQELLAEWEDVSAAIEGQ